MGLKLLLTFAFCLCATASAKAKHPSEFGLKAPFFKVENGTPVPRPDHDFQESKCARYMMLGRGSRGVVRRIQTGRGRSLRSFTRKDFESENERNHDYLLMQEYHRHQEAGEAIGFQIPGTWIDNRGAGVFTPDFQFSGSKFLYYRDVVGKELAKTLLDPNTDPIVAAYLLDEYTERLEVWTAFIRRKMRGSEQAVREYARLAEEKRKALETQPREIWGDYAFRFPLKWMHIRIERRSRDPFGESISLMGPILLKADAIIVDPNTLEMFLVDPD